MVEPSECVVRVAISTGDHGKGAERPKWYKHSDLYEAWGLLIAAAESDCAKSAAFTFDLVDVGREWIRSDSNIDPVSAMKLPEAVRVWVSIAACNDAYDGLMNASTPAGLRDANATLSEVMADLDRLLAASDGFLLGQWIS